MWLLLNFRFSYHNFNENYLSLSVGVFSFLQIFPVFNSSAAERANLQNEIERMKELLHTYETSIQRKDQVISNLTQALGKQRDKQEAMRTFSEWKVQHVDLKREVSQGEREVNQGGVDIAKPWSQTMAEDYDPHHVLAMVKRRGFLVFHLFYWPVWMKHGQKKYHWFHRSTQLQNCIPFMLMMQKW